VHGDGGAHTVRCMSWQAIGGQNWMWFSPPTSSIDGSRARQGRKNRLTPRKV
jgi:hypothetical protein